MFANNDVSIVRFDSYYKNKWASFFCPTQNSLPTLSFNICAKYCRFWLCNTCNGHRVYMLQMFEVCNVQTPKKLYQTVQRY